MASLKFFHANKIYDGGVHALKDFSLDVKDKEFVVFVGPSGCGKSTALRMIAGLEKITTGDLYIGDRLVNALPPKDRNIAMVFQSYALFPNMSVYDNISFGLRMQGEDKEVIDKKVNEAAAMLNLTDYLNRRPSKLSGGQKQRVALGRAIVRHPDIFLLDEPLSNLDAKLRNKMRSEIQSLHKRLGVTFIYVTHDQTEAMTMGDKIVVMRSGEIMQTGSPTTLYRYPQNKFVAGFIGTPEMNFWQGEITLADGLQVKTAAGVFPLKGELELRLSDKAKVEGKKVIVGLRPEDIRMVRKKQSDVELTAVIDVAEELCTHTVLHGKAGTADVVAYGETKQKAGTDTVSLFANMQNLHLFDAETEQSVLPQFKTKNTVKASKQGNKLFVLNSEVVLSDAEAQKIEDGEVAVTVPYNAFIEGETELECVRVLATDGDDVSLVKIGDEMLYASGNYEGGGKFALDVSKLSIAGRSATVEAVRDVYELTFTYLKRKETENDKTVVKHYCDFGNGAKAESFYEFNKKMYRLGKGVFGKKYKMYVSVDSVRPATQNECYPTVWGEVENVIDYGNVGYSTVNIEGQKILVKGTLSVGKMVRLALDLDNVSVSEADNETILF